MNGQFISINSDAYEMTSVPFFVCLDIFEIFSASTNPIVPGSGGRARHGYGW